MSKIALTPNASGTGVVTLSTPNTDQNRTITLPDSNGTVATLDSAGNIAATSFTGSGAALTGIDTESFKPVAVTGATPSLNVGSYNFFDQGALTANTTVSFASVSTNARWSYSYRSAVTSGTWDITTAAYVQKFAFGSTETVPQAIFFKPDGLKMYITGYSAKVHEYNLSTAWDVSTATLVHFHSVSGDTTSPTGLFFKSDGTKMFVLEQDVQRVFQYTLSTAWDVSTAGSSSLFGLASQDGNVEGVFFKPDGLKMYVIGRTNDKVYEYNLSTAWDITTSSYSQNFSVAPRDTTPRSVFFKPDGLKFYMVGGHNTRVSEYNLSTAWDITTSSYLQQLDVAAFDTDPKGAFFEPNGGRFYLLGDNGNDVNEFNLGNSATLTLPSSVIGTTSTPPRSGRVTYDFFTLDGGTTVNLIGEEIV
jgi:hypothetical protein